MSEGDREDPDRRETPSNLVGTVVRGVGMAAGGYVLTQVLTLGFYLVLARLATPEDFGQLAAASLVVGLASLVVESGMIAALIHREDRLEEAASTAVIATVLGGLGFALLALAVSPLVGAFFDSDKIAEVAAVLSGTLLLRAMPLVPEALLQRRFSFLRRLAVEPLAIVAFGVTATIATSNGMGVWGLVLGQYAAAITEVVLSWAFIRWRPRLRLASFAIWRELVDYGRHILGASVILRVGEQVPVALLGRFVSTGALGQYRYAERVSATPYAIILASASYVIFPAFARIAAEPARFKVAFLRSLRWMATISMPLGLILIPLGESLVVVVFGEVWRDAGEAVVALSVFTATSAISSVASEAFKAAGKPSILVRLHLVTSIVGAIAAVALLPLDLVGVCIGISIGAAAGATYALAMCVRKLDVPLGTMLAQIAPFAIAAAVMAGALVPLDALLDPAGSEIVAGLALLLAEAVVGAVIYLGVVHLLAPGIATELVDLVGRARRPAREAASPERELAVVADQEEAFQEARLRE